MAPRIVRPRSDSPLLPLTLVGAAACLVGGWFAGVKVFKPSAAAMPEEVAPEAGDAAAEPADAAVVARPPPDASAPAASATVTVRAGMLAGCGDGEEMSVAGADCVAPPELEPALRERLVAILGACPSAASAAADPSKVLSLGLRVDFPRRRVASLLGRSSTVPDKVSYVPCVNHLMGPLDAVWRLQAPRARYQFFFSARFSPLRAGAPAPVEPVAPAPTPAPTPDVAPVAVAPAPAPTPAEPDAGGAPAAPDPSLPTPADMLRMRVMDRATVVWSPAIVRETPRTGPVAARLPQGTAVEIVDRRGTWYGIRWDRSHTGWTYGPAIGQSHP